MRDDMKTAPQALGPLLFVIKNSALHRGMNTGIENLAWGLAERGFDVHVLSGGHMPARHQYRFPDTVTYHFTNNFGGPGDHLKTYTSMNAFLKFDVVIGWIRNIAPLSAFHAPADKKPRFIANEGQTTSRLSQFLPVRCLSSIKRSLQGSRFSLDALFYGCWGAKKAGAWMDGVVAISAAVSKSIAGNFGIEEKRIRVIPAAVKHSVVSESIYAASFAGVA